MKIIFVVTILVLSFVLYSNEGAKAQWIQCHGPGGGSVASLAVLGPYSFAGTSNGGMFRSTDSGRTWNPVRLGTINYAVNGITSAGSMLFAASDSLYVSNDSGVSWGGISLLPNESGPLAVLDSTIFLCSFNGIYRSTDFGKTWEYDGLMATVSLLNKSGVLFAGTYSSGLFQSNDTGATWNIIPGGILSGASIQSLAFSGNDIFAGGYYDEGFFRSTDNGVTWDTSNNGMPNSVDTGHHCTIMALYQYGNRLLAGTAEGIFVSSDKGSNWAPLSTDYAGTFARWGSNLLAGTDGGVMYSTDSGSNWTMSNTGLINTTVIALTSIGTHVFAGFAGNGIYRSDDSGTTWVSENNGLSRTYIDGFAVIDTTLLAFSGNQLNSTSDLGTHWSSIASKVGWPITVMGTSLIGSSQGFFLSSDKGASWSQRGPGFDWGQLSCFHVDGTNLYAGNSFGDCGTVYWSTDSAQTWTNLGIGVGCTDLYSLATADNYLFAGTGPGFAEGGAGMWKRNPSDTVWSDANGNLPDMTPTAIKTIAIAKGNIFFGSDEFGVFLSTNDGTSWDSINDGLTTRGITQLLIVPPNIYAGTVEAGVWRRPLSDFGISAVSEPKIAVWQIRSYPNPFSQSTAISFTIPESGPAQITILNLLGAEVTRVYDGELSAGEHSFTWDALGAAPGMYECVVWTGERTSETPIVLLR